MRNLKNLLGGSSAISIGIYLIIGLSLQGYTPDPDPTNPVVSSTLEPIIEDKLAPVIEIIGANPLYIAQGKTLSDPGATAVDETDGTVSVISDHTIDTTALGSYVISYTATDKAGNTQKATRNVIVTQQSINSTLLKTGQHQTYSDFDDAYSQQGLPRDYQRDDETGLVTDNSLELTWQDNSEIRTAVTVQIPNSISAGIAGKAGASKPARRA